MRKLSMNEITTFRWSIDQDIENYLEAGYDAIGIWLHKVADYGEDKAIDLINGCSLTVSNTVWAGGYTGSDGRGIQESIDATIHALRISAAIQSGCLVIYTGGRNNHTFKHADRLIRHALDELLPLAEVFEVPLAVEPMHPACAESWTFLTNLEEAFELVKSYNSPYLKLAYDTYHFSLDSRQHESLRCLIPHIGIIHLGDRREPPTADQNRCLLGSGGIPLRETVNWVLEQGYQGYFDVKLIGQDVEGTSYWTILEESRQHFQEVYAVNR